MSAYEDFKRQNTAEVAAMAVDEEFAACSRQWMRHAETHRYPYHFEWLGRPIIQYPQDMVVMQEIIWRVRPQVIVETGIAHGGSLIFYASMLELLALCNGDQGRVVGIDIDIRAHNRAAIEAHPLAKRITLLEGSSTDPGTVQKVRKCVEGAFSCLVVLDSNHTHEHVLNELRAYAPLVTEGSYCVVFDTAIEFSDVPCLDRPWGKGNNPFTATQAFLKECPDFVEDTLLHAKIGISETPGGYLRRCHTGNEL